MLKSLVRMLALHGGRGRVEGLLEVAENESDEEILKKYVAIHFTHKISPVLYGYLYQELIKSHIFVKELPMKAKHMQM